MKIRTSSYRPLALFAWQRTMPFQAFGESLTHRKRSTKVSEVAEMAAFLASDRGSGMTGTVANLTGGLTVD